MLLFTMAKLCSKYGICIQALHLVNSVFLWRGHERLPHFRFQKDSSSQNSQAPFMQNSLTSKLSGTPTPHICRMTTPTTPAPVAFGHLLGGGGIPRPPLNPDSNICCVYAWPWCICRHGVFRAEMVGDDTSYSDLSSFCWLIFGSRLI